MNESNKVSLKEGSQVVVRHDGDSEHPITVIKVQTETQVINYRLYMDASTLHKETGLSKSEVREYLVNAPQEKIATLDNKILVRVPTIMKWNLSSLQSSDPDSRARGKAFQLSAHNLITDPEAMTERAISAAFVTKKSNQAKTQKRRELRDSGQDQVCQLSLAPINGQETHMHHIERVADKPELAAESDNLALALVLPHQEEHKNDKTLLMPPTLDI